MVEVVFKHNVFFFITLLFYIDIFFAIVIKNFVLLTKNLNLMSNNGKFSTFNFSTQYLYFITLNILYYTLVKGGNLNIYYITNLILIWFILSIYIYKIQTLKFNKLSETYIFPLMVVVLTVAYTVLDYLTITILIEFYGIIYFFFFCKQSNINNTTSVQEFKTKLLLLLWNNFITSFLMFIGLFTLLKKFGTLYFLQLNAVKIEQPYFLIFLLGFFWKLGLPTFHFFKFDLYNYLQNESIFLFSLITTLINVNLLLFLITKTPVFSLVGSYNYIIYFIYFLFLLVLCYLKVQTFLIYLSISSIITITTILIILSI